MVAPDGDGHHYYWEVAGGAFVLRVSGCWGGKDQRQAQGATAEAPRNRSTFRGCDLLLSSGVTSWTGSLLSTARMLVSNMPRDGLLECSEFARLRGFREHGAMDVLRRVTTGPAHNDLLAVCAHSRTDPGPMPSLRRVSAGEPRQRRANAGGFHNRFTFVAT